MLNLIYVLAFTQLLTGLGLIILGVTMMILQQKIKNLEKDKDLRKTIRKYGARSKNR